MPSFDIERFLALSGAVRLDDLPWAQAAEDGLSDAEARILRYMADTESHTILYLRDLLAGHTCHDAEVTSFLAAWVYEELWHGRAIDRLLQQSGRTEASGAWAQTTRNVSWREPIEAVASHLLATATPRFVAAHMTWGALTELCAAAAYRRLAEASNNRVLKVLLGRIGKQERKHFAFYYQQAERRMAGDKAAQRLCKAVLHLAWTPAGSGVGHSDNLAFLAHELFADEEGQRSLGEMDATIGQLPGLSGFGLVAKRVNALIAGHRQKMAAPSPLRQALGDGSFRLRQRVFGGAAFAAR